MSDRFDDRRTYALPLEVAGLRGAGRLPEPLTPLVGRRRELAALAALLADPSVRLLTLTGPGGVGKSRLALAAARAAQSAAPGPVAFAPLAPLRDPALLLPALAAALGVAQRGERPLLAGLAAALAGRPALLVLDNCEQLLAAAPRLGELLAACPALTLLATSRAPLRLSGERELAVAPLPLPESTRPASLDDLAANASIRLFVDRARAVRDDFTLTPANAPTVVEICRRLDGLPLAIELAAARLSHLPPAALLARLAPRLPLLTGGPADAPQRLRTMRDAIGWSYDLLGEAEQRLFRRLAVFAGGFDLEAAESVGRGSEVGGRRDGGAPPPTPDPRPPTPDSPVLDLVTTLVDHSLVRLSEDPADAERSPRFGMLETVREFGLEQLAASGEERVARDDHAAYFAGLVNQAAAALGRFGAPEEVTWRLRLTTEETNLRAALDWLLGLPDGPAALRMAGGLGWYWFLRGQPREGRDRIERALAVGGAAAPADRARAEERAAWLAWDQGEAAAAVSYAEAALAIYQSLGDDAGTALAWHILGLAAQHQGDHERAETLFRQAFAAYQAVGDRATAGVTLGEVAASRWARGDRTAAEALLAEGLAIIGETDEPLSAVPLLIYRGGLAIVRGDLGEAAQAYGESLAISRRHDSARELPDCLDGIATIAAMRGETVTATRLFAAVESLRDVSGKPVTPLDRGRYDQTIATVRSSLSEDAFATAWAEGRALPLADALDLADLVLTTPALSAIAAPVPPAGPSARAMALGLTEREVEVLRLLVAGESNPEIAATLFISRGTVRTHVSNILAKLDAKSRTEAVALTHRLGLLDLEQPRLPVSR